VEEEEEEQEPPASAQDQEFADFDRSWCTEGTVVSLADMCVSAWIKYLLQEMIYTSPNHSTLRKCMIYTSPNHSTLRKCKEKHDLHVSESFHVAQVQRDELLPHSQASGLGPTSLLGGAGLANAHCHQQ